MICLFAVGLWVYFGIYSAFRSSAKFNTLRFQRVLQTYESGMSLDPINIVVGKSELKLHLSGIMHAFIEVGARIKIRRSEAVASLRRIAGSYRGRKFNSRNWTEDRIDQLFTPARLACNLLFFKNQIESWRLPIIPERPMPSYSEILFSRRWLQFVYPDNRSILSNVLFQISPKRVSGSSGSAYRSIASGNLSRGLFLKFAESFRELILCMYFRSSGDIQLSTSQDYLPLILTKRILHDSGLCMINAGLSPSSCYKSQSEDQIRIIFPVLSSSSPSTANEESNDSYSYRWPRRMLGIILFLIGIFIAKLALDAMSDSIFAGIVLALIASSFIIEGIAIFMHIFLIDIYRVSCSRGVVFIHEGRSAIAFNADLQAAEVV
jgi:hypothetical protein